MLPDILREAYRDRDTKLCNGITPEQIAECPERQCTICKKMQPRDQFGNAREGQVHTQCRTCRCANDKKNRERLKKAQREKEKAKRPK